MASESALFSDENAQVASALEEIKDTRAMIDIEVSPIILEEEYLKADSPGFIPGIHYLSKLYTMRRVRGDGNCFYRAFLFSYLEQILSSYLSGVAERQSNAQHEKDRIYNKILISKQELVDIGYSEMAIECFHDAMIELIESLFSYSKESLLNQFQEGGQSDYYTWFMRLLTAGSMIKNVDQFLPFVLDMITPDMQTYVNREVEPMGKECEQMHIMALCQYLGVPVGIEYLDGRAFDPASGLSKIRLPDTNFAYEPFTPIVTLLYRPGHYDILYSI